MQNTTRKPRLIFLLIILFGLVLAIGIIVMSSNSIGNETIAAEKGGQISLIPAATNQPDSGPKEPTPLPTTATLLPLPTLTTLPPVLTLPAVATLPPATSVARRTLIPSRIRIPTLSITTYVERVGVTKDGTMDVPKNIWNTAWFGDGGYKPGELGNAVIAGHLDAPGTKAVFWDLDKLKAGDKIYLTDTAGQEMTFEVESLQTYPYENAPLLTIFGPSPEARLNLITCRGTFDRATRNYNKRLVVFSRLVGQ